MKLITLNLWGGTVYEPLIKFIEDKAPETDLFSFQEMTFGEEASFTPVHKGRINLFSELKSILKDFNVYKHISDSEHFQREPVNFGVGQAIFIRNSIQVKGHGGAYCFSEIPEGAGEGGKATGNYEWVDLVIDGKSLTLMNVHGVWQDKTYKMDTPARIIQSNHLKDFLNGKQGSKILCGDFNLLPNTESVKIIENMGLRNLVKEYGVQSTRTSFYDKPQKHADYIFTSKEIEVKDFKVLPEEVSDHSALYLEFR